MTFKNRLFSAVEDIWAEYNSHPFVKGIENGTLDKEKFKYYIMQDYLYIIDYTRVFGIGIAKAKSVKMLQLYSYYVNLLAESELDIHRGYMGKLSITQDEIESMKPSLANTSYTSYMLRKAYEGGDAEILAAILPCAWSYEFIAQKIVENNPDSVNHPFYGDWVKGYAAGEYADANIELISTLEKLTEGFSEDQLESIIDIFVAGSRYELGFWDMAWNMEK